MDNIPKELLGQALSAFVAYITAVTTLRVQNNQRSREAQISTIDLKIAKLEEFQRKLADVEVGARQYGRPHAVEKLPILLARASSYLNNDRASWARKLSNTIRDEQLLHDESGWDEIREHVFKTSHEKISDEVRELLLARERVVGRLEAFSRLFHR